MARSDAFFAKLGHRPDISTISDRFFDENSINFFDGLLDDRRLLDDTCIVLARMRDVEKSLKNLDRAHKIRVRRRFVDPRSTRHELQTTSKIHRKYIEKSKANSNGRTIEKRHENRSSGPPKIDVLGAPRPVQRPQIKPGRPCSRDQMRIVARSSSFIF